MTRSITLNDLAADFVRSVLNYDPDTGVFRWRRREDMPAAWNGKHAGSVAGTTDSRGYIYIRINSVRRATHRLAFLVVTGRNPDKEIDHANLNRSDNRWVNLREASASQNGCNRGAQRNNKLGVKGVHRDKHGRYAAVAQIRGRHTYLGARGTPEEAAALYAAVAVKHFGEFARTE